MALRGITKRFPPVVANDHIDFEAAPGEVHALLGENGAGKTTLSNILTGLYRPDEGEIALFGETVEFGSPRDALDAGIAMVHQHFRLVEPFSVAENIALGDHRDVGRAFLVRRRAIEQRVVELEQRYGLRLDPRARVWQLSVGEQQRVEIIKALYQDARILILDEPTAVLTPQEADALFETVRAMAADGRTVIFISHKLHEVKAVADRVTVLRRGRSVATVGAADATPRSLAALMVGREVDIGRREQGHQPSADAALEVDDISADGDRGLAAVKNVSIRVNAGEIVALAGVAGNGQRELADAIVGMRPTTGGSVRVREKVLPSGDPRKAIAAGIAYVPEDRLGTGVAPGLSVASNVVLKSYREPPASRGPLLQLGRIRELAEQVIRRYDIRTSGPDVPAWQLSGGNLQKVVLAREFSGDPAVLVAAAPTRGLDISGCETVHDFLREAASRGVGVLLISEDLDEILALADRIVVIYEGEIVGERNAETATVEELGLLMAGG
ncbi:MAG: ABC transporter ATP-binding protein [Gaiellaceae bacterium]